MSLQPITEYSKKGLKNISEHLELSDWEAEPVVKQITFSNFADLKNSLYSILDAIEIIGYNGEKKDMATCAGLAELAKKMLPTEEMDFLDSLLIKTDNNKKEFSKIENV